VLTVNIANFAAFEIEDDLLGNLREYALANSLYWALCEGHACEISARRNAMDVSIFGFCRKLPAVPGRELTRKPPSK
jgi:secreted Zn-dependent insulinase-like peptidase